MREGVPQPGVDEFSPTVAPTTRPEASKVTEAATGVPVRADETTDAFLGAVLAERYRIDRRVGAGGMGAVYVGTHLTLSKKVAVKVIQPRLGADATIAQRFIQEARAASAIGHEHIVQITDFGTTPEGGSFLVMEYLDGEDLSETLRRDGPLPWQRVIHVGEQIAWALAAAHKNGIVHRDIKPANCYRVPREQDPDFIKVLDFGLAKDTVDARRDGESLTHTGMLLGTPGYIAPELYRGLKADHRVDIYALGALMHKLLTGELPPMCGSDEGEPMRGLPAPDAVGTVLGKALRENPDQRYGTAQELAQALRAIPRATSDEPTLLQRVHSGATPAPVREPSGLASVARLDRVTGPRDPGSNSAAREPTPVSFSSLVSVERDGSRVRLSLGVPALIMLVALVGGLVYFLTRPDDKAGEKDRSDRTAEPIAVVQPTGPAVTPPAALPVAAPPPATPPEPTTAVTTAPVVDPPSTTEPTPVPAIDPPPVDPPPVEPPPTKAALNGSPKQLARHLTRTCMRKSNLVSYLEVKLTWKIDGEGNIATVALAADQPQPLPKVVKDCIAPAVASSGLHWKPNAKFVDETLPIGKKPAPEAPAG